ncbi:glycosyltransferase family 4 protein [Microbacterium sulfonylureivorans]|uniref:glycosyltransferase family 4 protein n=1 Tax=Microbacterium sulfonylureivorans TaxID=2486854 RepID=UPI000FDA8136|nr:glycosyltransferase family 4 protein [Microbacterium sulfonylureivorans]
MRIALVASSYLPRFGGVEEHVHELSRRLRARGHEVMVWAVDQGDDVPAQDDGRPLRYLPTPLPSRSAGGVLRFAAALPVALSAWRKAFVQDAPDVIVIQCFGPNGPWAAAAAKRAGVPLVYANHGETFMDAHDSFASSRLLRRSLSDVLRDAAAVTSCSAYAAADLVRFGPRREVTVVGNGIDLDTDAVALAAPLPPRYFAGVGRLVENKGFDTLIEAYAVSRDRLDGAELVIAGDGPHREALVLRARELAVGPHVRFVGALPRTQVRTLLDGALAQVVPSRVEAFGIVVLEGWRSGIPVLATERGGPAEFMTDGIDGVLFDPEDPQELAQLLVRVAADAELRARLGSGGRQSVAGFTWDRVADEYEKVFRTAVPGDRARRSESKS